MQQRKIDYVDLSQQTAFNKEAAIVDAIKNGNEKTALELTQDANLTTHEEQRIEKQIDSINYKKKNKDKPVETSTFEQYQEEQLVNDIEKGAIEHSPHYRGLLEAEKVFRESEEIIQKLLKAINSAQKNLKSQKGARIAGILPTLIAPVLGLYKSGAFKIHMNRVEKLYNELKTPKNPFSNYWKGQTGSHSKGHVLSGAADATLAWSIYSVPATYGLSLFTAALAGIPKLMGVWRTMKAQADAGMDATQLEVLKSEVQKMRGDNQTSLNEIAVQKGKLLLNFKNNLETKALPN